MLSIIIPAKNEIYLERTIRDILSNAEGEIEIIAELDGWVPEPQINIDDSRVIFVHHKEAIGQRACINHGVSIAKGKYIMKLDAHCAVDKGFDIKLAKDCEYDWTVIPTMYNLDIETWAPKLHKITNYMYISSMEAEKPFRATYYEGREKDEKQRQPVNDKMIDDIMCCMGPGFFMHKERFLELGGCDEGHGGWGQQGIEVALKAWLSGGRLVVNKNTWFAHWFRGGGGPGFPYEIGGREQEAARKYSQDLWLNDKWPLAKRKLNWVIEKFNPPGWNMEQFNQHDYYYATIRNLKRNGGRRFVQWRGFPVVKYPSDLMTYQEIIFENQPDFIIETGTQRGGSALFFANMCDLNGKGQVISIDKYPWENRPEHPRITYLEGGSTSAEVLEKVREMVKDGTVMASLDSDHHRPHVKRELRYYSEIVTPGQYMVVEDTIYPQIGGHGGPDEAIAWFMSKKRNYKVMPLEDKWVYTQNPGGFLKRVR